MVMGLGVFECWIAPGNVCVHHPYWFTREILQRFPSKDASRRPEVSAIYGTSSKVR
jgi:hypothetical protein